MIAEPSTHLLEVVDLKVHFPVTRGALVRRTVGSVRAVDGVSLTLRRGETLGLVGESGSGKTTLGRTIVGLYRPTAGIIRCEGRDVAALSRRAARAVQAQLQMVFQDPFSSLDPRWRIESIINEPLRLHRIGDRQSRRDRVRELLEVVGLSSDMMSLYPRELSGGQRQRVGLARALALRPAVLVADEAVSALDVSVQAQILNLLHQLQREFGLTYLFVAHDLAVVRHLSDRVAVMYLGKVVEQADTAEMYERPSHPYTVSLLSAIPVADPDVEAHRERIVLPGEPPSPASPPTGCRFHPRCWLYQQLDRPDRCRDEDPELRAIAPGHVVACHYATEQAATRQVSTSGSVSFGRTSGV